MGRLEELEGLGLLLNEGTDELLSAVVVVIVVGTLPVGETLEEKLQGRVVLGVERRLDRGLWREKAGQLRG